MDACPHCHRTTVPRANFCTHCGTALRPFCRPCRIELPGDSQFCYRCGDSVECHQLEQTTQVSPPSPVQNFEKKSSANETQLMPQQLRQKIQGVENSIEGERKLVSIVFADISGFTAMSEKMDAEKVTDIMNQCFQRLGSKVYEFEGYIDKFMGDCIMALFGAPIAHENDPELAVKCALKMMEALSEFNQETGFDLKISIGINAGIVIAGGVGTDQKFEYTVMGDAVNLAQRLESAAKPGQILVSRNIYSACEKNFEFIKLEPIRVKGKENLIEVYSAERESSGFVARTQNSISSDKLVGREKELKIASQIISQLNDSRGQILFVSGEAGVGKSRFKHEIRKIVKTNSFQWHEGKCQHLNQHTAYFSISHLIQSILDISGDSDLVEQKKAFKKIDQYELDDISVCLLADLLGIPIDDDQTIQLDAGKKKKAMFLAIKKLILKVSLNGPVVFYLEDLHWMDPISLELVNQLMDAISTHPILIYGSFRRDFAHQWHDKSQLTQINLQALTEEQSLDLVSHMLNMSEVPESLSKLISEKSDGNPLYIEEIIKSLVDTDQLKKSGSSWKVNGELEGIEIPTTLQGLIAARIDRLHGSTKKVLQYASVIGRQFSDLILADASQLEAELSEALSFLRKKELIFELSSEIDEIIYIFKHALTQEVAYESILRRKRKEFHEKVAQSLEALFLKDPDKRADEQLESLAHHYLNAENSQKAIHYLHLSAKRMASNFSNEDALKSYSKAIDLIHKSLETTDDEIEADILYSMGDICTLVGDYEQSETHFQALQVIAERTKNNLLLAKAYRRIGDIYRLRGNPDTALELLQKSLSYSDSISDFEGKIRTLKALGAVSKLAHEPEKALEFYEEGLSGARSLKNNNLIAEYLNDIAIIYIGQQDFDKAEAYLSESISISNEVKNLKSLLISSTLNLGVVAYYRKNFKLALVKFKEASAFSKQIGDLKNIIISTHNIGEILKEFENYEEALNSFQEAYSLSKEMGNELEELNNLLLVGHVLTKLGKGKKGERILVEGVKTAESKKYWSHYCDALVYLGKYYHEVGDLEKSKESFKTAQAKAKEHKINHLIEQIQKSLEDLDQANEINPKAQDHEI